ncbi:hypothetical protein BsWGS_28523 [Bradybaena similaris]
MDMDGLDKVRGLSRWERKTNHKVHSRSHRVTSTADIHDWIKTVEEASDRAADAAFGLATSGKQRGRAAVELRTNLVRNHELAYTEAQELLTQWVNDTIQLDVEDGFDDLEAWRRAREVKYNKESAQKRADDSEDFSMERLTRLALEEDIEVDEAAIYERVKRNAVGDMDPYANLYELEEKDAVDVVLQNMLSKDMVKDNFKKDLGFGNDLPPDPRTKMELRHNVVKENREKRHKEGERKKMETQIKKEARLTAQQLILKEQKDRETRARKEEMALRKEMARIRKEMHEERTRKVGEMRKVREEKELLDRLAREELDRQMVSEEKDIIEAHRLQSDRRKKQIIKIEMVKAKIASHNLQCLHRHLTAWYDLVLSRRLLMGKVKAMSDWKLMLKVWGAWRMHSRHQKLEMETEIHERNVIDTERKRLAAERHYTHRVLRRCFLAWHQFINEVIERKELEKEQERTKSKMVSLLNAVASGRMSNEEQRAEMSKLSSSRHVASVRSVRQSTDSQRVDNMFQQPVRKQAWVDEDSVPSSVSETSVNTTAQSNISNPPPQTKDKGRSLPTQPWQVTRQHLKVTDADLNVQQNHTDAEIRKKFGTQPWMNRHFVVNNYEHRYTAQQQTLREQQSQIREQRRLIEELQYNQRQQVLRQQLGQGSDPHLPSLPAEVEVPPPGRQIPRGDNADSQLSNNNKGDMNDKLEGAKSVSPNHLVAGADLASCQITEVTTFRSEPSSSRTDQSSAATASHACFAVVKVNNTKHLKVLKNIEDRAAQRAKLKAEREERKRKQEEEKLLHLQKVEEETQRTLEAARKAKVEAYREKKRLEKQKEEEKRKQLSQLEEMNKMADEHYKRSLMKYRGLLPFKKIISLSKKQWSIAIKHRDRAVVRQCLQAWRLFADEEINRKQSMADQMYQVLVIKHSFQKWKNYKHHMKFLTQRADRHYNSCLRYRCFLAWVEWHIKEKQVTQCQLQVADSHFLKTLTRKTFLSWRDLPDKFRREQEREQRRKELRQKVAELIPDFSPQVSAVVRESEELS